MSHLWTDYRTDNAFSLPDSLSVPSEEMQAPVAGASRSVRWFNPLVRFQEIFDPLLGRRAKIADTASDAVQVEQETRDLAEIADLCCHMLAQLDRVQSIHVQTVAEWTIDHELRAGAYGRITASIYTQDLAEDEQRHIVMLLRRQEAGDTPLFHEAVTVLFPGARCCYHADAPEFLIDAPQAGTQRDARRRCLLTHLFSDLMDDVRFFWRVPFGIVGVAGTMHFDAMQLY